MRPPHLIHRLRVIQLDVQVLIHALERPADLHFVLEFDGDFVLDEGFEETGMYMLAIHVIESRGHMLQCGTCEPEEKHCGVGELVAGLGSYRRWFGGCECWSEGVLAWRGIVW
jgi:hypothetical protein